MHWRLAGPAKSPSSLGFVGFEIALARGAVAGRGSRLPRGGGSPQDFTSGYAVGSLGQESRSVVAVSDAKFQESKQ
jgi:hypothetical protein